VELGYLTACLGVISLLQCIKQAQWPEENPILAFPGMIQRDGSRHEYTRKSLSQLLSIPRDKLDHRLPKEVVSAFSLIDFSLCVYGNRFLE
jgi:hypothetical protein